MAARWATPDGWTVEDITLELVKKPKRDYDPAGIGGKQLDGPYLLIRAPGATTASFVTGVRFERACWPTLGADGKGSHLETVRDDDGEVVQECRCRFPDAVWADVAKFLDLSDLARTDLPDDDLPVAA